MNKRFIVKILSLVLCLFVSSMYAQTDTLASKINAGQYQFALEQYQQQERHFLNASQLHNMGICLQNSGNTAEAIVAYEQSLALNPLSQETRENLRLIYAHEGLYDGRPIAILDDIGYIASPKYIGGVSIFFCLLAIAGIVFVRVYQHYKFRKIIFYISSFCLSVSLLGNMLLLHQWYYNRISNNRAIIIRNTPLIEGPQKDANTLVELQPGTPVSMTERGSSLDYIHIELADGREGWIDRMASKAILPI